MAGKAPPSFNSFPDLTAKPAPPSFTSFPSPPRPSSSRADDPIPPPAKRPRAAEFLDELGQEIGVKGGEPSSSGRSERRERDDVRRRREHDSDRRQSSKGKDREKDRDRLKEERGSSKPHRQDPEKDWESRRRRDDRSERRSKGKEREKHQRDSDYGPKRSKSYQLVQAATDVDIPSPAAPVPLVEREKPLFYESRRGDDYNIVYGGLHRGDVPKYRREGAGRVIGLNDGLRITKETAYSGRGVEIAPLNRYKTPRYVDPSSARHVNDKNFKRIVLLPRRQPQALGEPEDPFLPSSSDTSRFVAFETERSTTEKLAQLEHEEGTDYRSISGLIKPSDLAESSDDEDDVFSGLGISGGESHADYLRRRNLELDRALRGDPSNIQLWLEFVEFQDEVAAISFVGTSSSAKRALSTGERTSTSEIKLAILDRALAVEANAGSEELLLAYLRAAAEVEDPKKVLQRWKDTLRTHPNLTGLWIEYVSWRQTSWVNFTVRDVVGVFEECFEVLRGAMEREEIGSNGRELLEGNAIYLFLRLCLMLRQAGYSERALAAFQAEIELNLLRPDHLAQPSANRSQRRWSEDVVAALEGFWDTEALRVGEKGAKGWRSTTEDDLPPEAVADGTLTAPSDPGARPFERWAAAERLNSYSNSRPARTSDPGMDDSEDPFRVILFDDIRDFLFIVHSPDSKLQLVYAFLTFLGLPFVPPDFPTSTPFTTDSFIHSELVERPNLIQRFWPKQEVAGKPFDLVLGEAMEPERRSALKDPFGTPFSGTPAVVDLLFGGGRNAQWFTTLAKDDLQDVDVDLGRNTLELLRQTVPDPFLTLDEFALEAAQSPKRFVPIVHRNRSFANPTGMHSAVKMAKQILRDRRQDLALWDGYARIERQRGKTADARQVYCTALGMYRSFAPPDQIDAPLLWRAWAEMEWEEGNPVLALKILSAATSSEQVDLEARFRTASLAKVDPDVRPPPAQILRARQYYTTQLEAAFQPRATQAILRNRNHVAYSSALFEYLTRGLDPAVDVLERHLFRLECAGASGSAEHEEAYMLYSKLLYRHMAVGGGYRPAQLRELLERAIKEFKNNTLFLSLFYYNELRMKIQNRVRRTLEEYILREKDATSGGWLFAIFAELHLDARSQNVWAVRNLFDRAVDNPRTRSSASLWVLYVDFEVRNGELQRAKSLIYRALRECPWCKGELIFICLPNKRHPTNPSRRALPPPLLPCPPLRLPQPRTPRLPPPPSREGPPDPN
ncbi:SPOSA6832_03893, partial [Sporobolomyces salmonicolor]